MCVESMKEEVLNLRILQTSSKKMLLQRLRDKTVLSAAAAAAASGFAVRYSQIEEVLMMFYALATFVFQLVSASQGLLFIDQND